MNLLDIPAIDQHAHNLLKPEAGDRYPYAAAFTEGRDASIWYNHARHTLFYQRSLRDIAQLLNCEPLEETILKSRSDLGLESLTNRCFQAANLEKILLDDGLMPHEVFPLEWHRQFCPVYRLLRLEYLAENLLSHSHQFETFLEQFRSRLDPPPPKVVGFKSIAAYRTGLEIQAVSEEEAESSFYRLKQTFRKSERPRLSDKILIDFLVRQALEIATKYGMPLQVHTGFGDRDLDLRLANPLYLRSLLENSAYSNSPIVLLHACYPYVKEAGYLASVYPQVYVDFGLAVPMLSVAGMRDAVQQLLELAPATKILYSSDAHMIPELYYLGAKWGRQVLGDVLERAVKDADLTIREAENVAAKVLRENAIALYRL